MVCGNPLGNREKWVPFCLSIDTWSWFAGIWSGNYGAMATPSSTTNYGGNFLTVMAYFKLNGRINFAIKSFILVLDFRSFWLDRCVLFSSNTCVEPIFSSSSQQKIKNKKNLHQNCFDAGSSTSRSGGSSSLNSITITALETRWARAKLLYIVLLFNIVYSASNTKN